MLCLVAIFKNESEILDEWLQHYINEGVDHFFLIDNGSNDNYEQILTKYDNVTLIKDDTRHAQIHLYNKHFLEKVKLYDWTIVCDLDEFIYSRHQHKTIASFLSSVPNIVSQIAIPWKMFGSNGFDTLDKKEPASAIKAFTKRANYNLADTNIPGIRNVKNGFNMDHCKCIVRSSALEELGIHNSKMKSGITIESTKRPIECSKDIPFVPVREDILQQSYLQLNHYAIRSLDWFTRIKMTRGDVNSSTSENVRNYEYFHNYDVNDIDDFELRDKKYD